MRSHVARYLTALSIAGAAIVARFALDYWFATELPFITFFPAVAITALLLGPGPASLVTVTCLAVGDYLYMDPRLTFDFTNADTMVARATFLLACALIIATQVVARRRQARAAGSFRTAVASEAHFRLIADTAPMLIWASDENKDATYFNQRWLQFTGRGLDEELGDGWREGVHPEDFDALEARDRALDKRSPFETYFRLRAARGQYRWMLDSGAPLFDSDGRFRGYVGSCVDITDRKEVDETRAWLAAVVSTSNDAIISKTLDGIILSWNASAERLFGYTAREAIGSSIGLIVPPELRDEETGILARLRRGEFIEQLETVRVRKDGLRIDVSLTISPIRDESGRIVGASKAARDITEHKRALAEVAEMDARYRAVIESQSEMLYRIRPDGTILFVNGAYARALGMDRDALIGRHLCDFVPAEEQPKLRALVAELTTDSPQASLENQIETVEGMRWMLWTNRAIRFDKAGAVLEVQATGIDITDRKRAEESLREASRRKDEFLAVLGHELRNPLAPLRNGIELLKTWSRDAGPHAERVLAMMDRQLAHLLRLVDDLLDISRIGRGKADLKVAQVDVRAVIRAAVEQTQPLMAERGHSLQVRQAVVPLAVTGDLERLIQVVANLLANAATYTEPGGRIDVRTELEGEDAVISVRDTGLGIAPEYLDTVFEPFAQVATQEALAGARGLGIGLALSREIVRMHGGKIEARSAGLGHGSEFRVSLPSVQTDAAVLEAAPPPLEPTAVHARRILVVDDNTDAAESLQRVLQVQGHTVCTAADGYGALEAVEAFGPAVVLLDIGLPELDGYEVARRIRALPHGREILLCAVTGWGQADDKQRARDAGFDEHMTKPVDLVALAALIAHDAAR